MSIKYFVTILDYHLNTEGCFKYNGIVELYRKAKRFNFVINYPLLLHNKSH